jgi:hypothetical protein
MQKFSGKYQQHSGSLWPMSLILASQEAETEDHSSKPDKTNSSQDLTQKNPLQKSTGRVVQVVEPLPSNVPKALYMRTM